VVCAVLRFDFRLLTNGRKTYVVQWQLLIFWQSICFSPTAVTTDSLHSMHSLPIALQNKLYTMGQNFLCALSVTGVGTAFRGRAAPVLVYKERESTLLRPVKRSSCLKFLWLRCHILFLMFLHVVRLNEIGSFGSPLLSSSWLLFLCVYCMFARK
jgi:hypothetical protein